MPSKNKRKTRHSNSHKTQSTISKDPKTQNGFLFLLDIDFSTEQTILLLSIEHCLIYFLFISTFQSHTEEQEEEGRTLQESHPCRAGVPGKRDVTSNHYPQRQDGYRCVYFYFLIKLEFIIFYSYVAAFLLFLGVVMRYFIFLSLLNCFTYPIVFKYFHIFIFCYKQNALS